MYTGQDIDQVFGVPYTFRSVINHTWECGERIAYVQLAQFHDLCETLLGFLVKNNLQSLPNAEKAIDSGPSTRQFTQKVEVPIFVKVPYLPHDPIVKGHWHCLGVFGLVSITDLEPNSDELQRMFRRFGKPYTVCDQSTNATWTFVEVVKLSRGDPMREIKPLNAQDYAGRLEQDPADGKLRAVHTLLHNLEAANDHPGSGNITSWLESVKASSGEEEHAKDRISGSASSLEKTCEDKLDAEEDLIDLDAPEEVLFVWDGVEDLLNMPNETVQFPPLLPSSRRRHTHTAAVAPRDEEEEASTAQTDLIELDEVDQLTGHRGEAQESDDTNVNSEDDRTDFSSDDDLS